MTEQTRTFFLKTSSNNYETKVSNADFKLKTDHTPVELNNGVVGVSLASCTFPQNQPNITASSNTLYFTFDDTTLQNQVTVTANESFRWRYYDNLNGIWSSWLTHTASGVELVAPHLTLASLVTQLNTNFQAAYNAETGNVGTEVTFAATSDYFVTFTNSGSLIFEFDHADPGGYLALLGFSNSGVYGLDSHPPTSTYTHRATYSAVAHSYSVPVGQYDITELAAVIEAAFIAAEPTLVVTVNLAEISTTDQRLTIECDQKIYIYGINQGSTIGPLLGIGDDYDTSADGAPPYNHYFSYVANLHGPTNVYLQSKLLAGRTTLDGDTGGIVSIVKQIPITAGYRDLQVFGNEDNGIPDISFARSRRKHFTEVDVRLVDHNGNTFDIGNGEVEVMWKLYY